MKLVDLDPGWCVTSEAHAAGRTGMGMSFRCPCRPACDTYLMVWFANPVDGGVPAGPELRPKPRWRRTGDTFETITLDPSVDADTPLVDESRPELGKLGHWHGFIRGGEIQ